MDDFDRCTPLEFEGIYASWSEASQMEVRTSWEQTRLLAVSLLQPFSRHRLDPRDVMMFGWDQEQDGQPRCRHLTAEERDAERRHYEEVKKARGLS